METLEEKKVQAEIDNLQAQALRARADAIKIQEDVRKSWHEWILEGTKVLGALILGLGGITAAITGYQLSEIKKERLELEISKSQAMLDELQMQKSATQEELAAIKTELVGLQTDLQSARTAQIGSRQAIMDNAITRAAGIERAIASTKQRLVAPEKATLVNRPVTDFIVGLQTLGLGSDEHTVLNRKLQAAGYRLHTLSNSLDATPVPEWFSSRPTVLYYSRTSLNAARQLAQTMQKLTGSEFVVQRGAGVGVDPGQAEVTLFVHYRKDQQ